MITFGSVGWGYVIGSKSWCDWGPQDLFARAAGAPGGGRREARCDLGQR